MRLIVGALRSRWRRSDDKRRHVGEPELQCKDSESEDEMQARSLGDRQRRQYRERWKTNDHRCQGQIFVKEESAEQAGNQYVACEQQKERPTAPHQV